MKMKHIIALLAVVCALGCKSITPHQSEFFLVDDAGTRHGPYHEFFHGDRIDLGGKTYTVFVPDTVKLNTAVGRKMQNIIIPDIAFHGTPVLDVVDFLMLQSIEHDSGPRNERGVNFLLAVHSDTKVPLLTFTAKNLSLFDATSVICGALDLKWSLSNSIVLIELKDEAGPTLKGLARPRSATDNPVLNQQRE